MKLSLLLFASTLFAAGFPSPTKDSSLKDLVVRLESGELYKLEIFGIPVLSETIVRVTQKHLKQSYAFRLEIPDLNSVACGESFKDAVGRLAFEEGKDEQPHDFRFSFTVSGRDGTTPVSLYVDSKGVLVDGNMTGEGRSLVDWLGRHLGECVR